MLVKKINPEWKPSENPELRVGDTIDITDPKQLIIDGEVVAVGAHGEEKSPYEMYGVLVDSELEEFKEFTKMKKAQALKKSLEAEQAELQKMAAQLDKKPEATQPAPAPVSAEAPVEAKKK